MGCHHGAHVSDRIDRSGNILEHDTQRKCTGQRLHGLLDGRLGISLVEGVKQSRNHLGIRLGHKLIRKAVLRHKLAIVLDDTVMDQNHLAASVGMRICIRYAAVGRPSGMADTAARIKRIVHAKLTKLLHLAGTFSYGNPLLIKERDARTVITSVLQSFKTADDDILRRLISRKTDNSAHSQLPHYSFFVFKHGK